MKGHGPFTVTLQDGREAAFTGEDTFEVNGAIITVHQHVAGHGEDQVHIYKLWRDFDVAASDVEG
jgi:hypothetical protein